MRAVNAYLLFVLQLYLCSKQLQMATKGFVTQFWQSGRFQLPTEKNGNIFKSQVRALSRSLFWSLRQCTPVSPLCATSHQINHRSIPRWCSCFSISCLLIIIHMSTILPHRAAYLDEAFVDETQSCGVLNFYLFIFLTPLPQGGQLQAVLYTPASSLWPHFR